jgi:predicted transcriptional regulator of viral defense system
MKYPALRKINSLYFTANEVAEALNIRPESARVLCSRYVTGNMLIRLKRNVYMLKERWDYLDESEIMRVANILQVPSYISLTTALSYYSCTTQIQRNFVESVCLNRTYNRTVEKVEFNYIKVSRVYYSGFDRQKGVFIASPEKALADALYLTSLGRYSLDFAALEKSRIDLKKLEALLKTFPEKTAKLWRAYGTI